MAVLAGLAAKALGAAMRQTGGVQQPRAAAQPVDAGDLAAELAGKLGLNQQVVAYLHRSIGLT